jgi:uncharacterized protein HemY
MTYNRITEVFENYINGNLKDFRRNLKNMTKRDIVSLIVIMANHYEATEGYEEAMRIVKDILFKYLP